MPIAFTKSICSKVAVTAAEGVWIPRDERAREQDSLTLREALIPLQALAAVLGMEGGIGTAWGVGADGKFTGEMDGPFVYGNGKVEASVKKRAIELCERYPIYR